MKPCDLCGLDVGAEPLALATPSGTLEFCCKGCLEIYRLLHDVTEAPPEPDNNDGQSTQGDPS